jgi:hypothetical protein
MRWNVRSGPPAPLDITECDEDMTGNELGVATGAASTAVDSHKRQSIAIFLAG